MTVIAAQESVALSIIALGLSLGAVLASGLLVYEARRDRRRQASLDVLNRLENVRKQRERIRAAELTFDVDWSHVDQGLRDCFDEVARAFDIVAALDHMHLTDGEFIAHFFANAFHELWTKYGLADYVRWVQSTRGGTHYWELAQFDGRLQKAVKSHPFYTGSANWRRLRRKRR